MIRLPSSFCPSVGYLSLIAANSSEGIVVDLSERYQKQTLRNRAFFMTASGAVSFSIPVAKHGYPAPPVSEIGISEHGDWRHKLEHALRSGYGTTPFWDHYEPEIVSLVHDKSSPFLTEYNQKWLRWLCSKWDLEAPRAIIEKGEASVCLSLEKLSEVPQERYWQPFEGRYGFTSGLSSLDLLLSEGPYAIEYLIRLGQSLASEENFTQNSELI